MKKLTTILITTTLLLGASMAQANAQTYKDHQHNWNNAQTSKVQPIPVEIVYDAKTKTANTNTEKGAAVSNINGLFLCSGGAC
jgi:hypothetical protein